MDPAIFLAIIHFSSKYTYTTNNVIRKDATPFIKNAPKVLAKTKKIDQKIDMYAILRLEYITNEIAHCDVITYLGEINNPQIESQFMQLTTTAHWQLTKKMAQKFQAASTVDLTPLRHDHTQMETYSIDPEECLDIDDALHAIQTPTGYTIGIHIADVTSYIAENTDLDNELKNRTETIYPPNNIQPIHMIPSELSLAHISLLSGSPKRAFSLIIHLNTAFQIQEITPQKTLVQIKTNLTYDAAQQMITTNPTLQILYTAALHLKKTLPSTAFPDNDPYDTHQMVAIYMLLANKFVAEQLVAYDPANALLRSHHIKPHSIPNNCPPTLAKKYSTHFLEQASYQIGTFDCAHQGINLPFYTHFTSPIRRYADILVHRQLYNTLTKTPFQQYSIDSINIRAKHNKQSERYHHIIQIANSLKLDCVTTDAHITYIDDDSIKLYIPIYNIDYDYRISPKMKDVAELQSFNLFQKIQIKIIASSHSVIKLKVEILST